MIQPISSSGNCHVWIHATIKATPAAMASAQLQHSEDRKTERAWVSNADTELLNWPNLEPLNLESSWLSLLFVETGILFFFFCYLPLKTFWLYNQWCAEVCSYRFKTANSALSPTTCSGTLHWQLHVNRAKSKVSTLQKRNHHKSVIFFPQRSSHYFQHTTKYNPISHFLFIKPTFLFLDIIKL